MAAAKTSPWRSMPPDLVDDDHNIKWIRVEYRDGPLPRGKAIAHFANEWGIDFTDVRVSKVYMQDPGPECEECGATATCGIENDVPGWGESRQMLCYDCRLEIIWNFGSDGHRAISFDEAKPYDGWSMVSCRATAKGATAYWEGRMCDEL